MSNQDLIPKNPRYIITTKNNIRICDLSCSRLNYFNQSEYENSTTMGINNYCAHDYFVRDVSGRDLNATHGVHGTFTHSEKDFI